MAKYMITVPVELVVGYQFFTVDDVNSEDEAIDKFKTDGGDFYDDELEVQEVDLDNVSAAIIDDE